MIQQGITSTVTVVERAGRTPLAPGPESAAYLAPFLLPILPNSFDSSTYLEANANKLGEDRATSLLDRDGGLLGNTRLEQRSHMSHQSRTHRGALPQRSHHLESGGKTGVERCRAYHMSHGFLLTGDGVERLPVRAGLEQEQRQPPSAFSTQSCSFRDGNGRIIMVRLRYVAHIQSGTSLVTH